MPQAPKELFTISISRTSDGLFKYRMILKNHDDIALGICESNGLDDALRSIVIGNRTIITDTVEADIDHAYR